MYMMYRTSCSNVCITNTLSDSVNRNNCLKRNLPMYDPGRFIFPMRFSMWAWKVCGFFNAPVPKSVAYRVYCYAFYSCIMAVYLFVLLLNVFVPQPFEQRVFFIMYIFLTETAMILKTLTIYRHFNIVWSLYETTLGVSFQPRDEQERELQQRRLAVFNRWYYAYIFVSHMAAFGTGSHLLSAEYRMPFFPWFFGVPYGEDAHVAYYTIFAYQSFGMYFHMLLNTAGDTQLCYMMHMIGIQLELLGKRFRNLNSSDEFDRSFVPLLNLNDFSKLMNVFYMMSMTMQIGLPCYYGNEVTLKSYALTNAIYSSRWYNMPQRNRKSVQMFLVRTNKPFAVTAFVVNVRNGRIESKIHLNDIAKQSHHDEPEREVVQYVGHLPLYLTAVQIDQG
uniref:Odorant receptor n=1 Tax=Anopheles merus TaxID=30066 RepID=A0A182V188_ANOME